jgi:hypothetical protein
VFSIARGWRSGSCRVARLVADRLR